MCINPHNYSDMDVSFVHVQLNISSVQFNHATCFITGMFSLTNIILSIEVRTSKVDTYSVMTGTSWELNPIEHKIPEVYVSGGTEPSEDLYIIKQCQDHKM